MACVLAGLLGRARLTCSIAKRGFSFLVLGLYYMALGISLMPLYVFVWHLFFFVFWHLGLSFMALGSSFMTRMDLVQVTSGHNVNNLPFAENELADDGAFVQRCFVIGTFHCGCGGGFPFGRPCYPAFVVALP